jgi:hypothetical protein
MECLRGSLEPSAITRLRFLEPLSIEIELIENDLDCQLERVRVVTPTSEKVRVNWIEKQLRMEKMYMYQDL